MNWGGHCHLKDSCDFFLKYYLYFAKKKHTFDEQLVLERRCILNVWWGDEKPKRVDNCLTQLPLLVGFVRAP